MYFQPDRSIVCKTEKIEINFISKRMNWSTCERLLSCDNWFFLCSVWCLCDFRFHRKNLNMRKLHKNPIPHSFACYAVSCSIPLCSTFPCSAADGLAFSEILVDSYSIFWFIEHARKKKKLKIVRETDRFDRTINRLKKS